MTLDQAKSNQIVQIDRINGGWGVRQRLNQVGIFEGSNVRVKRHSQLGGPILLEYNNSKIAIGRGMAAQISIKVHDHQNSPDR